MFYSKADNERIFPITKHYLKHEMVRGSKAAGVKTIRIHDIRHFAASALISAGLDVTIVSGALGHCNSGTTLNTYSHMFQTAQAGVAEAMDGAFSFLQDKKHGA